MIIADVHCHTEVITYHTKIEKKPSKISSPFFKLFNVMVSLHELCEH